MIKHRKVSKYYETDCRLIAFGILSLTVLRVAVVAKLVILGILYPISEILASQSVFLISPLVSVIFFHRPNLSVL